MRAQAPLDVAAGRKKFSVVRQYQTSAQMHPRQSSPPRFGFDRGDQGARDAASSPVRPDGKAAEIQAAVFLGPQHDSDEAARHLDAGASAFSNCSGNRLVRLAERGRRRIGLNGLPAECQPKESSNIRSIFDPKRARRRRGNFR
jgi:hypothetical protein